MDITCNEGRRDLSHWHRYIFDVRNSLIPPSIHLRISETQILHLIFLSGTSTSLHHESRCYHHMESPGFVGYWSSNVEDQKARMSTRERSKYACTTGFKSIAVSKERTTLPNTPAYAVTPTVGARTCASIAASAFGTSSTTTFRSAV